MHVRAAELRQDLLGRSEGEIMQHDDDILHVTGVLLACHHGRGQHLLFADRVRVHPVRAGRKRELESVRLARGERPAVRACPILIGRCFNLPVPMHLQGLAGGVEQAAGEALSLARDEAGPAAGTHDAEDFRGLLVDLDRSCIDRQHRRGGRCGCPA